jgi:putative acetyltransferase
LSGPPAGPVPRQRASPLDSWPATSAAQLDQLLGSDYDADAIRGVLWSAFPEGENEIIYKFAIHLLSEETTAPTVSLVAEADGVAVGHVAFSPLAIDSTGDFRGYILAPPAVSPDYQKRGIGSRLVKSGMKRLAAMGVSILFVYEDSRYYGRFGFSVEAACGYVPPCGLRYPFGWQGLVLRACEAQRAPTRITCVTALSDPTLW